MRRARDPEGLFAEEGMGRRAVARSCLVVLLAWGGACAQTTPAPASAPSRAPDRPLFRVTSLSHSGPGSLREALSEGNRNIVFDVGGNIDTAGDLAVAGLSSITIDGSTAPPPGITITGGGALSFENGAHDIVVKSIRVRNGTDDNIRVYNSHDIVFDHVSSSNARDGALDVTEGSYNVTVQWSILISPSGSGTMLIKYNTYEVTLHHNLFHGTDRNPLLSVDETATSSSRTMADIRNNIVWNWGRASGTQWGYGVGVDHGARANIVNNFFQANGSYPRLAEFAIDFNHNGRGAQAYVAGNVSGNGVALARGDVDTPFVAPAVSTDPTCTAASKVLAQAGARPLDAIDQALISAVSLANCSVAAGQPGP
jgi:pectate lyase